MTVYIKWNKTLQASRDTRLIPLASISGSPLCPRQAIISLGKAYPVHSQAPMFSYMDKGNLKTLTQLQVRAILSQTLTSMGLNAKDFGFHTFRRSGASLAFSRNVPVQYINAHGIWSSDAVYSYLYPQQYPTTLTTTMTDFLKSNPQIWVWAYITFLYCYGLD